MSSVQIAEPLRRVHTPIAVGKKAVFDFREALNKSGDFTSGLVKTPNDKSFDGKPDTLKTRTDAKPDIMRELFTGQSKGISASKKQ